MKLLVRLFLLLCLISCETKKERKIENIKTVFERSNGEETATYLQIIDFYIQLAKEFPEINIQIIGTTDSGNPLHVVTYNPDADFNFQKIGRDKSILFINNGIHPGESDGIDATMLLFRDLALKNMDAPENTVVVTIPVYNVGGALNRNSTSRVNQNGPKSHGFRGNAKNYDLNRDFIKVDSKNAHTFAKIFHLIKPDIFIDNHVSNGADYQYTLTHLFTQHNKLGGELGNYLHEEMVPTLENSLAEADWDITPYVNVFNQVPEKGFSQFMDYPRYSTGYTTLWNTLGLMVETHMLKPYKQRVEGVYALMTKILEISEKDYKKIKNLRENAFEVYLEKQNYPLQWAIDTTKSTTLEFKGYEADEFNSEITGLPRLKYDRNRPFVKDVEYQNFYYPTHEVEIPKAYVIKKGWDKIIDLLTVNQISFKTLKQDTSILVESYKIDSYSTAENSYEGHYPHYNTKVLRSNQKVNFTAGDILVPTNQKGLRYLLETLEPEATDSFFNWNFFDAILQQKEGFSPYVFEDIALEILQENQEMKTQFNLKKEIDSTFSGDWYAQLDWIYKRSKYYEPEHNQYPIYRILKE
ncbi:M14 family metallopeptidase [Arenibacter sp. S6351L]|uniref:M14 family metallopeptidase n=1 Tax=Arenibacter sp. S6351L TaxID=2926407 RepID=UPI001FF29AB2|nr:M14 family metallopeptidase [Arenibacter sp. S6351L]MCK0136347.1 M14 family metallopeptidase [Arenibacter sp. S6351L]